MGLFKDSFSRGGSQVACFLSLLQNFNWPLRSSAVWISAVLHACTYLFVSILKYTCVSFTWNISALVSQDRCNKRAIHWGTEAANNHFSHSWRLKVQDQGTGRFGVDLVLVRVCFLVHRWLCAHCVLMWQRGPGSLWGPFYKGTNPFHEGSTLMT